MLARLPPTICWSAPAWPSPTTTAPVTIMPAASNNRVTREVAPMSSPHTGRHFHRHCPSRLSRGPRARQLDHVAEPGEIVGRACWGGGIVAPRAARARAGHRGLHDRRAARAGATFRTDRDQHLDPRLDPAGRPV